MLAQVRPVVRPLLATTMFSEARFRPCHRVDDIPGGAAASMPFPCGAPNSRMAPLGFTALAEFDLAMAASTLVEDRVEGHKAVERAHWRFVAALAFGLT